MSGIKNFLAGYRIGPPADCQRIHHKFIFRLGHDSCWDDGNAGLLLGGHIPFHGFGQNSSPGILLYGGIISGYLQNRPAGLVCRIDPALAIDRDLHQVRILHPGDSRYILCTYNQTGSQTIIQIDRQNSPAAGYGHQEHSVIGYRQIMHRKGIDGYSRCLGQRCRTQQEFR
ncbi:MAG: hypothetical protein BWY71_01487 [Planctomycetes bacterium ADurb.Bin412]|nr:MAG: hypothetical protein BWY71_01487 [Planctomycetes bacterium ADurb.Bin412]